jgi:hypothetical protein
MHSTNLTLEYPVKHQILASTHAARINAQLPPRQNSQPFSTPSPQAKTGGKEGEAAKQVTH